MPGKTQRSSNLELLRILCMLLIIGDHRTGQGGIADYTTPVSYTHLIRWSWNSARISSGRAEVQMSQSPGIRPSRLSRTQPPTT